VNPYTVIILSAKIANVASCVMAIRRNQPGLRIVVVADGIAPAERAAVANVEWIEGVQPFCYARNANLGIAAAGASDVILCNDDAQLATVSGFECMQDAARSFGIVSATIRGRCCNPRQQALQPNNVTEPSMLAFVCVYLPRTTIDAIGGLDERYVGGNFEDNDYCRRATLAGLPLGICGGCVVDHRKELTTFETRPNYRSILETNRKRFEEKWARTRTLLSVCVCSIFSRNSYLDRLLACLAPQWTERVEFLLSADDGQENIGAKRQRLLDHARGDYIVFIDDDDLVAPDYIAKVLGAILRNPSVDAITYFSKRYCDGIYEADCSYSLTNASNKGFVFVDGIKTYNRWPYHVTPIRRELARQVKFPSIDFTEDTCWAEQLRPLLKTEVFLPEFLYFYYWRSNRSGERTHKMISAPAAR
jgi:GT2 family glycosyltransferase